MVNTKLVVCEKCWGTGHVNGGDENSTWSKNCEDCHGIGFVRVPMTNADCIRVMDDVELMNKIYELHVLLSEFGHYELTEQFCDCKAECAGGEDCNEDRLKACILRRLQQPVEEVAHDR